MSVHLEGMGWLGAATGLALERAGIPFTWNDTDSPHVAWRASTGIVYPAGDTRSEQNMRGWQVWENNDYFPAPTVIEATWCFAHKNPPHQGRYTFDDLGWIRAAHARCYAVDVPEIVRGARERFDGLRVSKAPARAFTLVTHGFNERLASYMWGWSAKVKLELPEPLASGPYPNPALYGRLHRFAITYLYPVPTMPGWWWAGSTLAVQKTPARSDAYRRFEAWRKACAELYPGVKILDADEPIQGWRPRPANDDPQDLRLDGLRLTFPPLWHSGVRWAPTLVNQAVRVVMDYLSEQDGR